MPNREFVVLGYKHNRFGLSLWGTRTKERLRCPTIVRFERMLAERSARFVRPTGAAARGESVYAVSEHQRNL